MEATLPHSKFEAWNVNDANELLSLGVLEVSPIELIHTVKARGSSRKTSWPLIHLRSVGCSGTTFCFEAGRRCSTGEGLFAFRCSRAPELLQTVTSMLQSNSSQSPDYSIPAPSPSHQTCQHSQQCRSYSNDDGYEIAWEFKKLQSKLKKTVTAVETSS